MREVVFAFSSSKDIKLRKCAAESLNYIESNEAESLALKLTKDESDSVRYQALATYSNMKKQEAWPLVDKMTINLSQKFILSITENGFGNRTDHNDYRVTNRGGKGIIGIVNSSRNGNVSSSFPVNEGDEILISTNRGRVIRTAVKEIRVAGRNTQGVRIIKLSGEEKVVSAIKIDDNLI